MAESLNPAASHYLPSFITPPGDTDVLMVVMSIFLVLAVLMFGILFFRLHTLPERMAHKTKKVQLEIVAVLGLIALFTHMHIFWVAGLLLALIELPDFGTPLRRIARSTEKIAGLQADEQDEIQDGLISEKKQADQANEVSPITQDRAGKRKEAPLEIMGANKKEVSHA
jgi:hypothetical protein